VKFLVQLSFLNCHIVFGSQKNTQENLKVK